MAIDRIGKYRVLAKLGQGGMARVLLTMAEGPHAFHKLLVVKELKDDLVGDADFLAMFLDEARIAARLNHPNIVQTYEVGNEGERYFIAMEYLEGQPLNAIFRRVGRRGHPRHQSALSRPRRPGNPNPNGPPGVPVKPPKQVVHPGVLVLHPGHGTRQSPAIPPQYGVGQGTGRIQGRRMIHHR